MKSYRYNKLSYMLLVIILLSGCASTGAKKIDAKDETAPKEEVVKAEGVRISEFILDVGDSMDIAVYRHDDLKKSIKINSSGRIMYPLIGDVKAAGRGVFEIRDEIQQRLSRYVVNPQVTINITSIQSQKVIVLGEVNAPGVFTIDTNMSVTEAISKAGGMKDDAKLSNVVLIRRENGKAEISTLDLKKALSGDFSQDRIIRNGDIVYMPSVLIADISWFFGHIAQILSPIVNIESGIVLWPQVKSVLSGKDGTSVGVSISP